ncbi:MAG: cellulose binding domain-containing protein [Pseudomonadota bacterium]
MAANTDINPDYRIFQHTIGNEFFEVKLIDGALSFRKDGAPIAEQSLNAFLAEAVASVGGSVTRNGTISADALEHFGSNTNPSIRQQDADDTVTIGGSGVGGSYRAAFGDDPAADAFEAFANDLLGSDPARTEIFSFNGGTNGGANTIRIFANEEIIALNGLVSNGFRTPDSFFFEWSGQGAPGRPNTNNLDIFIEEMGALFDGVQEKDGKVNGFGNQNQARLAGPDLDKVDLGSRGVGGKELWDFDDQNDAQNFLDFFNGVVTAFDDYHPPAPIPAAPTPPVCELELVSVNDWYNPAWGGGFNATFALELTEDLIEEMSVGSWTLDIDFDVDGASFSAGWMNGFNAPVDFDPATGVFSTDGQSFQQTLYAGDVLTFSVQVQGAGFDMDAFSCDFADLDPELILPTPADAMDVAIDAAGLNDWGSGAVQHVNLTNNGSEAIDGWTMMLDLAPGEIDDIEIANIWGATYTTDGEDIFFSPLSYTEEIGVGGTESFGFVANFTDNNGAQWDSGDFVFA